MKLERMLEIRRLGMSSYGEFSKHMTEAEIDEVNVEWDKNPNGFSSFASTLFQMIRNKIK